MYYLCYLSTTWLSHHSVEIALIHVTKSTDVFSLFIILSRTHWTHTTTQILKTSSFLHGFRNIFLLIVFLPLGSLLLCFISELLLSTTWHFVVAFSKGLCKSLVPFSWLLSLLSCSSIPHDFSQIYMPVTLSVYYRIISSYLLDTPSQTSQK